jgi:DNA-directed RNA polymerase subunit K/omega
MSDISNIKNIHKITINEDNGMLSPTTEELTGGKLNRYQIAYGAARGARIITNEYVRQRAVAEKLQAAMKDAGGKEAEKPIATMVDPDYRDQKSVRLAITKIASGEYTLVEREGEIVDIDAEAAKRLAAELAVINKQREREAMEDDDIRDIADVEYLDEDEDDFESDGE